MRYFVRWRVWAPLLVTLVLAGFLVLWWFAETDGKAADLAANGVGGAVVALALLLFERSLAKQDEAAQVRQLLASDTDVVGVDFSRARLRGVYTQYRVLRDCAFNNADLRGAHLDQADLARAHLVEADLRRASMWRARLTRANLTGADLRDANLGRASLPAVDLSGARLDRAELFTRLPGGGPIDGADLRNSLLYGTDLRNVVLVAKDRRYEGWVARVDLTGAQANEETRWPDGFSPEAAGVTIHPGDQRSADRDRAVSDPGWDDVSGDAEALHEAVVRFGPAHQKELWASDERRLLIDIRARLRVLVPDEQLDEPDDVYVNYGMGPVGGYDDGPSQSDSDPWEGDAESDVQGGEDHDG